MITLNVLLTNLHSPGQEPLPSHRRQIARKIRRPRRSASHDHHLWTQRLEQPLQPNLHISQQTQAKVPSELWLRARRGGVANTRARRRAAVEGERDAAAATSQIEELHQRGWRKHEFWHEFKLHGRQQQQSELVHAEKEEQELPERGVGWSSITRRQPRPARLSRAGGFRGHL